MDRRFLTRLAFSCLALAIFALAAINPCLRAEESPSSTPDDPLIVHEWGTFTSFSGSDGVNLEFRPLTANDLPRFIMTPYNQPGRPFASLLKNQFVALQRMETPVTYFYTDSSRTVNVRVDFPQGMLSEWYPVVADFNSGHDKEEHRVVGNAFLDWGRVNLIPPEDFARIQVRGPKDHPLPAELPAVKPIHHYGRARETDSAIVETVDKNGGSHFEKFLFYRGLSNFELPVALAALGNDRFEITSTAIESIGPLFLVRMHDDHLRFTRLPSAPSHKPLEVTLDSSAKSVDELAEALVRDLTAAGLYEKESRAMVSTWRDSWFTEPGTRLLYLLPQSFTEATLPLTVDPAPSESVRVLVGRLETLTPEDCQQLQSLAAAGVPTAQVAAKVESFGRFVEPALNFVIAQTRDEANRARLEVILAHWRQGTIHYLPPQN